MLQSFPSLQQEMDFHDVDRACWMCQHFQIWNSAPSRCSSYEMRESVEAFMGVKFTNDFFLPVDQKTDASSCVEFTLRDDRDTYEMIVEIIEERAKQYRAHTDHYNHLRRTEHAY